MFALKSLPTRFGRRTGVSLFLGMALIVPALFLGVSAFAQPAYQTAVMALNPVAYWRLNELTAPSVGSVTAVDISGNGFNGTYGTACADEGSPPPYTAYGPLPPAFPGFETNNGALGTSYGESNSWITVPALNLNTSTLTMTMWIYPIQNQAPGAGLFFWRGTNTAGLIYNNLLNNNNLAYNWGTSSDPYFWQTGLIPPVYSWSFVALIVTPTNATIYLINANGLSNATMSIANAPLGFDSPSYIGADTYTGGDRNFGGGIDEVALFNYPLSEFQLANLYTAGSG